jgi:hypothetical protein
VNNGGILSILIKKDKVKQYHKFSIFNFDIQLSYNDPMSLSLAAAVCVTMQFDSIFDYLGIN